jgi:hypothetical protein
MLFSLTSNFEFFQLQDLFLAPFCNIIQVVCIRGVTLMNMKKNHFIAVGRAWLCVCVLLVPLASCNFFGLPEYELSVTIEAGVQGTPLSGKQVLADLTAVEYAYTPLNSLHTVEVIFSGSRAAASGTVTMYNDITMLARLIDIRAVWNMTFLNADSTSNGTSKITFFGADILGGTFSDSLGNAGTWDAASNVININYSNWENYKLTGTLFSMSGTWSNGTVTGTWSAVRE